MKKLLVVLAALFAGSLAVVAQQKTAEKPVEKPKQINAIVDLAHGFSFYGDGRFFTQYLPLPPQNWKRNMASFRVADFANANINFLVLLGTDHRIAYTAEDVKHVMNYVKEGGTLFLAMHPNDRNFSEFNKVLNVEFIRGTKLPLVAIDPLKLMTGLSDIKLETRGDPGYFRPGTANPAGIRWEPLIVDQQQNIVAHHARLGKGIILMMPRAMIGQQPNAKDNINAEWLQVLLPKIIKKEVTGPLKWRDFANQDYKTTTDDGITFHYNEYLKPYYTEMVKIQAQCRPAIEKRMGVPLSGKNASDIALLATDGGGFSSGRMVALAVFWENFPARREGMVEFITHETVHSWVLPFPEIWNEPIATYVGNLVMCDLGYEKEGMRRIQSQIKSGQRVDSTLCAYDLAGNPVKKGLKKLTGGQVRENEWGKTYWIFEQLRAEKPDFMARYFQAKRKYADPAKVKRYGVNETVAVMSIAMEKDLFDWFAERGLKADKTKSQVPYPPQN